MTQSHDEHTYAAHSLAQYIKVFASKWVTIKIVPWSCVNAMCIRLLWMCFKQVQKCDSILRREGKEKKRAPSPGSTALDLRVCVCVVYLFVVSFWFCYSIQIDISCGLRFAYDGVTSFPMWNRLNGISQRDQHSGIHLLWNGT